MQKFTLRKVIFLSGLVSLGMGSTQGAFAEAPVYDADSLPQQFYNGDQESNDAGQSTAQVSAADDTSSADKATVDDASAKKIVTVAPPSNLSVEERLRVVEQQIANLHQDNDPAKIEALQASIQALQGQVEQLSHSLDQAVAAQKALPDKQSLTPAATGSSVKLASATPKTVQPAAANTAAATADDADAPAVSNSAAGPASSAANDDEAVAQEQQIYQTAYNQIKVRKYDDAVKTLQDMLKKYPDGQYAANAHYWLGELYGLMGDNDKALSEFNTVANNYSDSPRLADAHLKIGLILASQSKWADAKTTFRKIISRFPGTASARLAAEQLKVIKQEGH